jgi:predicted RNA-binding protein with PIN domain
MKHYIIDGNNLLGKIPSIKNLQKLNKQASREKLAFLLGRYISNKKVSVDLHFDGYLNEVIKVSGMKINYSGSLTADERIKKEIERIKNPKNIIVVTSDSNLAEFARVCSCSIIKSEDFAKQIHSVLSPDDEQARIDELNSTEEFKKLFGVK